jgi:hypothetical protein
MRFVAEQYGESALLRWSREYGSSCASTRELLPGALNRSIRHVTGKTWVQIYDDFKNDLTRKYSAQRDSIVARGVTPTHLLLPADPNSPARPVFTPDGRELIVLRSDGYERQRMARIAVDAPEPPSRGTKIKWQGTELRTHAAGGPTLSAHRRPRAHHN